MTICLIWQGALNAFGHGTPAQCVLTGTRCLVSLSSKLYTKLSPVGVLCNAFTSTHQAQILTHIARVIWRRKLSQFTMHRIRDNGIWMAARKAIWVIYWFRKGNTEQFNISQFLRGAAIWMFVKSAALAEYSVGSSTIRCQPYVDGGNVSKKLTLLLSRRELQDRAKLPNDLTAILFIWPRGTSLLQLLCCSTSGMRMSPAGLCTDACKKVDCGLIVLSSSTNAHTIRFSMNGCECRRHQTWRFQRIDIHFS